LRIGNSVFLFREPCDNTPIKSAIRYRSSAGRCNVSRRGHCLHSESPWSSRENRDNCSSKAAVLLRVIGSLASISAKLYSVVVVWGGITRRAPRRLFFCHIIPSPLWSNRCMRDI